MATKKDIRESTFGSYLAWNEGLKMNKHIDDARLCATCVKSLIELLHNHNLAAACEKYPDLTTVLNAAERILEVSDDCLSKPKGLISMTDVERKCMQEKMEADLNHKWKVTVVTPEEAAGRFDILADNCCMGFCILNSEPEKL